MSAALAGRAPRTRLAAPLLLAVAFVALALPRSAAAVEVQRVVSPGGIEAWLVDSPTVPIVSMRFAFRGGARLDPADRTGLSQLVSGLLDEGAGDMDSRAYQTAVDAIAAHVSYSAGQDEFTGSLTTLTETRDKAFGLLALALNQPRFDADAVERVRAQILTGLKSDETDANSMVRRLWYRTVFGDRPYARPVGGTIDGVKAITPDDLHAYAKSRFTRATLVVGVAGDMDAATLAPLLDRVFGGLPEGTPVTKGPEATFHDPGAVKVERLSQPQTVVMFGERGIARDDPDFYAAYVVNHILGGGGFSSRLMEEVREKRGLAYGVYTYLAPLDEAPVLGGSVATANGRVADSMRVISEQFKLIRDKGVGAEELADAKTYLTGSFPLELDNNGEIAGRLVGMQISDLGIDYLDRRNALIDAVTVEDANRVARRLFDDKALTWAVVGDPEGVASSDGAGG